MSTLPSPDVLSKPSLAALSFVLRNREMWPEGFEWDYSRCTSCAMGLAFRLGWATTPKLFGDPEEDEQDFSVYESIKNAREAFYLSESLAHDFFTEAGRPSGLDLIEVTPEHVADLIDAHLANA